MSAAILANAAPSLHHNGSHLTGAHQRPHAQPNRRAGPLLSRLSGFTRCNAALTPIRPPSARLTAGGGHRARAPTQVVVQGLDDDAVALTARQRGLRRKPRQQRRLHPRHGVHVPRLAGAARQPPIREPLSHTPSAESCRCAAAAQQPVHYPSWMRSILLYFAAVEHAVHKSCPTVPCKNDS